uniref:NADH dehydrogenase [ubiquinone] 1 beta subcomplex subunit 6 n=1 Tax=Gasterosteus aculeatus aculeatus TaxID=481459 RepID=A0AAQ4RZZ1_GASAC
MPLIKCVCIAIQKTKIKENKNVSHVLFRASGCRCKMCVLSYWCVISACSSSFARTGKCPPWCHCRLNIQKVKKKKTMSGYTPDEKLRVEQIRTLRRRWLKDQELSPRESAIQAKPSGAVAKFWAGFLEPKSLWRLYTYKAYNGGVFALTRLLIPAWIAHYCVKYHIAVSKRKCFTLICNASKPVMSKLMVSLWQPIC